MFWFKKCPRCSGDLYEEGDQYGNYVTCVQCGFCKDIHEKLSDPGDISLEPVPAPSVPKSEGGKRRRLSHGGRHFGRTFARPHDSGLTDFT
jgi:hypothetical protein